MTASISSSGSPLAERLISTRLPTNYAPGATRRAESLDRSEAEVRRKAMFPTVSEAAVGYIELPGVGHGFDLVDGTRTAPVLAAIGRFLHHVHQQRHRGEVTSAV